MKLLLANHFPLIGSGSGTYTLNLAREMTKMGHRVTVLAPAHVPDAGYPFAVRNLIFSSGTNGGFDLDFNFPCFTTHPRSRMTFYALTYARIGRYTEAWDRLIAEAIASERPDLVHAQHAWVIPSLVRKTGIPYVVTVHGTDLMGYRNDERYRDAARAAVEGAGRLITISRWIDEDARALFNVAPERTVMIHNGFDAATFHPKKAARPLVIGGLTIEADRLISFVGKFTRFKGADVLLRAAALYEKRLPGVATVLAGAGELEDELKELVRTLALRNVHFAGLLPADQLADLYSAADVSVVPSRVEPFGLVAIEAMACGTPVIATNAGGLPDFVNDSVGALVDVDNPRQLAETIVRELEGNAKKLKGPRAARWALDNFQWSRVARQVEAVYREVISR